MRRQGECGLTFGYGLRAGTLALMRADRPAGLVAGKTMAHEDVARALWGFTWRWIPGRDAIEEPELLTACAELFESDYAVWGAAGPRPGQRVAISAEHVRRLLDSPDAHLVSASAGDALVGYAIVLRFTTSEKSVAWIAQLVVAATYRQSRVATTMLFSAWQFSDFDVWGLVTANPYAVRALETATRRPCRASSILSDGAPILQALREYLTYLPEQFDEREAKTLPSVFTDFPIDLSGLDQMKKNAARADRPWNLGHLEEGHEWFAATFSSQAPSVARGEYLDQLLEGIDVMWIRAYEGMTLDQGHKWHRHGAEEADAITDEIGLPEAASVLDAGCGDARHSIHLAERGYSVTAVDISNRLLARAEPKAQQLAEQLRLVQADLRSEMEVPPGPYNLILCLYDVLGSSAHPNDDRRILDTLRRRIHDDGVLVISVMNSASTLPFLQPEHLPRDEESFVTALEKLPPSRAMEQSGAVFDPAAIVYYDGRFYRKEQFDRAADLPPSESIIRDRRFTAAEIVDLVVQAGFKVMRTVGVRAGRWAEPLDPTSPEAKEILLFAHPR